MSKTKKKKREPRDIKEFAGEYKTVLARVNRMPGRSLLGAMQELEAYGALKLIVPDEIFFRPDQGNEFPSVQARDVWRVLMAEGFKQGYVIFGTQAKGRGRR